MNIQRYAGNSLHYWWSFGYGAVYKVKCRENEAQYCPHSFDIYVVSCAYMVSNNDLSNQVNIRTTINLLVVRPLSFNDLNLR